MMMMTSERVMVMVVRAVVALVMAVAGVWSVLVMGLESVGEQVMVKGLD